MKKLQDVASLFNDEFKTYIEHQEGWAICDLPNRKDQWYKLIPERGEPYYISFNGPMSFKTAVDVLIKGFIAKVNMQNNVCELKR